MVSMRSFLLSRVRVVIIAGTLQPKPISIGINDLPWSPIRCIILSIRKAALDIYPVSSNSAIQKNRINMFGRKIITLPTPAIIPFITRSFKRLSERKLSSNAEIPSTPMPIHSMGYAPNEKVNWNIAHIKNIKIGNPINLCVSTRSIFRDISIRFFVEVVRTSFIIPAINPYRSSVITISGSSSKRSTSFFLRACAS